MAQQNTNMKKENHIVAKAAIGTYLFVITLLILAGSLSSCQTVKEMNMSSSSRATQCNWVNNR